MAVISIEEVAQLKGKGRLLALDLGEKRIGVAVSDATWLIANPLQVIEHKKFTTSAQEIFKAIDEHKVVAIVIGLPLNMDGTEGARCQSVRDFARNLLGLRQELQIVMWDERLSTVAAETVLIQADLSRAKRKKVIDKQAACFILQGALDRLSSSII